MSFSASSRLTRFLPYALTVLAVLSYINSFPGTFILDDLTIVKNNALVNKLDLITIFSADYWHPHSNSGLFRPLTILSLALNKILLGTEAWGFHLINVLLHALVTMLLWKTLKDWGATVVAASVAAMIFAVHPLHADVVNIVVGRSELLVALFLLSAFSAARRNGAAALIVSCLCYLLALLSKENAATFIVLLPLWDMFHHGFKKLWQRRWQLYASLVAITGLWLLWRSYGVIRPFEKFHYTEAAAPLAHVDHLTRVLTSLQHQWLYLGKMFLPTRLQAVYSTADMPEFIHSPLTSSGGLTVIATLIVLLLLLWGWRKKSCAALFGTLYLVAFLPTSNLLMPIGVTMAERLAYFPSIWFCAALGTSVAALSVRKKWQPCLWLLTISYIIGLGAATYVRNLDFASSETLWRAEVAENPDDFLGWDNLAASLAQSGRYAEAESAFMTMLELAPEFPAGLRTVAGFYSRRGLFDLALPTAEKVFALSLASDDRWGVAFDGLDLAEIYIEVGRCAEALEIIEGPSRPIQNQVRYGGVRALALTCLGRDSDAVDEYLAVESENVPTRLYYRYGLSLFRLGRLVEARVKLEKATEVGGGAEAWNLLGVIHARQGDSLQAAASFKEAIKRQPGNQRYIQNLERVQQIMHKGSKETSELRP